MSRAICPASSLDTIHSLLSRFVFLIRHTYRDTATARDPQKRAKQNYSESRG